MRVIASAVLLLVLVGTLYAGNSKDYDEAGSLFSVDGKKWIKPGSGQAFLDALDGYYDKNPDGEAMIFLRYSGNAKNGDYYYVYRHEASALWQLSKAKKNNYVLIDDEASLKKWKLLACLKLSNKIGNVKGRDFNDVDCARTDPTAALYQMISLAEDVVAKKEAAVKAAKDAHNKLVSSWASNDGIVRSEAKKRVFYITQYAVPCKLLEQGSAREECEELRRTYLLTPIYATEQALIGPQTKDCIKAALFESDLTGVTPKTLSSAVAATFDAVVSDRLASSGSVSWLPSDWKEAAVGVVVSKLKALKAPDQNSIRSETIVAFKEAVRDHLAGDVINPLAIKKIESCYA